MLKGLENLMMVPLPPQVYHYTTPEKFLAILESDSLRLHTIHNFSDKLERQYTFPIEDRVKGTFTDKATGRKWSVRDIVRDELSDDHVFIQSNCRIGSNPYLWDHYAQHGQGICLHLSPSKFVRYQHSQLPDSELLPEYFKCCHVMYDTFAVERLLQTVADAITRTRLNVGHAQWLVWFFYVEYFRSLVKTPEPYALEEEVRFMVSDHYTMFLKVCSVLATWGLFPCTNKEALAERFASEYGTRVREIRSKLGFESAGTQAFVKVPLHVILEGVTMGYHCHLTKEEISRLSDRRIRKSMIKRSGLRMV
jgi:hypothetical protein